MGPTVSTWKLVLNPTTYKMLPQLLPNVFVRGDNSEARIRPIFSLSQFCLSSSLYAMWRSVIAKTRCDDPLLQQPIYEVPPQIPWGDVFCSWPFCHLRLLPPEKKKHLHCCQLRLTLLATTITPFQKAVKWFLILSPLAIFRCRLNAIDVHTCLFCTVMHM